MHIFGIRRCFRKIGWQASETIPGSPQFPLGGPTAPERLNRSLCEDFRCSEKFGYRYGNGFSANRFVGGLPGAGWFKPVPFPVLFGETAACRQDGFRTEARRDGTERRHGIFSANFRGKTRERRFV